MGNRSGILLCKPFEERRLRKWGVEYTLCQPKLDGERCRAIIQSGHVQLLSSEQNEILSVPHINATLEDMQLPDIELDGELYTHGTDFSNIHSVVGRTVNLHEACESIGFHIFDLISEAVQLDRFLQLSQLLRTRQNEHINIVDMNICRSLEEIMICLERYTDEGYEGVIVRHPFAPYERKRSSYVMKFKPRKTDIYKIIGYQEEISKDGHPKGTLGAFILVGDDGTTFNVGSGFTANQRREFWSSREDLIGMYVEVKYQSISPKHVPRFPIFSCVITPTF